MTKSRSSPGVRREQAGLVIWTWLAVGLAVIAYQGAPQAKWGVAFGAFWLASMMLPGLGALLMPETFLRYLRRRDAGALSRMLPFTSALLAGGIYLFLDPLLHPRALWQGIIVACLLLNLIGGARLAERIVHDD